MALDERQQQITEGAGLEASRLNVEFIDWLRRWSTPILAVIAVVVLGYVAYGRWHQSRRAEIDRAFAQYDAVVGSVNPSPDSLKTLAEEFEGARAVPHMARLKAADIYLRAARRGLKPGVELNADGTPKGPDDLLNGETRERTLAEAQRLYQQVFEATAGDKAGAQLSIGSAFGLAAVAECRGDATAASVAYKQVVSIATTAGFTLQAEIARQRAESLATLQMPTLYAKAELPKLPWADELTPPPPPAPDPSPAAPESTPAPTGTEQPTSGEPGATPGSTPPAGSAPAEPTPAPAAPPPPA